jgi:hypothetical protein
MGFRFIVESIKPESNLHSLEIYLVFMCKSVVKQKVKCTYHADCRAPISNDLWTLNIQIRFGFFLLIVYNVRGALEFNFLLGLSNR